MNADAACNPNEGRTGQLNYLNVGCGDTYHPEWTNVDMAAHGPGVRSYNLLKRWPYSDGRFQAVYHSHVLEHFPREKAEGFIRECFRVLRPGGVLRVVVPDLENIAREYVKHLNESLVHPSQEADARYDWIMIELYDQVVRNHTGGQMAEFSRRLKQVDPDYLAERIGCWDSLSGSQQTTQGQNSPSPWMPGAIVKKTVRLLLRGIRRVLYSDAQKIGRLRLSGEIHMWMYDRHSLARLLKNNGFENIQLKGPLDSGIPEWSRDGLDVKDGQVRFPTSLFMEASRPQ